jgi:hypothetical protein
VKQGIKQKFYSLYFKLKILAERAKTSKKRPTSKNNSGLVKNGDNRYDNDFNNNSFSKNNVSFFFTDTWSSCLTYFGQGKDFT